MTTLLIDGDIFAFQASSSAEVPTKYDEDTWILWASEAETFRTFDRLVSGVQEQADADKVIVVFSDKVNFRKELCDTYKANRKDVRKPMTLPVVRAYAEETYDTVCYPRLEGDDVLGILGTSMDDAVLWSADKDLMQIPCKHLVDGKVVTVSEEAGDYFFYKQILTGDATDNYKGCPTIGPVKAERILTPTSEFERDEGWEWTQIVAAYEKQGLTEDDALLQAHLARILRHGEYNNETNQVDLWRPNSGR